MRKKQNLVLFLFGLGAACLTAGCSSSPDSLAGTSWKLVSLTTPSGTEYDEAAYDMIIGETVYSFDADGGMTSTVGEASGEVNYSYTYEKGDLKIFSDDFECLGTVKQRQITLKLGEEGKAVLNEL